MPLPRLSYSSSSPPADLARIQTEDAQNKTRWAKAEQERFRETEQGLEAQELETTQTVAEQQEAERERDRTREAREREEQKSRAEMDETRLTQKLVVGVDRTGWTPAAYRARLEEIRLLCRSQQNQRAHQLLQECPPINRGWEWSYLERLCNGDDTAPAVMQTDPGIEPSRILFTPDGHTVVVLNSERIQLWDAAKRSMVRGRDHHGVFRTTPMPKAAQTAFSGSCAF